VDHRVGRIVFAVFIGLLVAVFSYQWITDPAGRAERILQENVVEVARGQLKDAIGMEMLEIVDPLSPNRKVGKVYVFPEGDAWAVSGYYRRGADDRWHPYLMALSADLSVTSLKIQDKNQQLIERAALDPQLEVSP